ncbi:MAG: hypothetical protein KGD67_09095 [Candidatus Lokiarchaeota archaeon]|nr:hypothetical protein [Candidatus Lokiarchaeota archaeon]
MEIEKNDNDPLKRENLEKDLIDKERIEQEKIERERIENQKLEQERLKQQSIELERFERERFEQLKMDSKLYPNHSLFMIPSWSDLLGYPTLGTYVNHPVSNIEVDPVIFLSGYDYSIETPKGTLHYLFGLGYHFLKFELESGKYVTDNRILTGLVLSDFVYDLMATSGNITLEDDREVIIAEKAIKVPLNLSNKSNDHLTFIKGVLMRNVFIPNKDIILEMMDKIVAGDSFQISIDGHAILSSHRKYYNQILVSDKMKAKSNSSYLNPTAGLDGITFMADTLLEETISSENLSIIEYNINTLKQVYSNIEFDQMYLFSILEQAALTLSSDALTNYSKHVDVGTQKISKQSIFFSAEDRLFEYISWPVEFPRKIKKEPVVLPELVEPPSEWDHLDMQRSTISDVRTTDIREIEQESFELDRLKSTTVDQKLLPPAPKPDIKEILLYLKHVIEENYEMPSIGQAFELARESAMQMGVNATTLYQSKIWEMSKYTNIYIKKEPGFGLPKKEKGDLIRKINEWVFEIEENERLERERIEKARLEKERLERFERERIEREKQEEERRERKRLEQIRLEKERLAREQKEKERMEKIKQAEEDVLRLDRERLDKERQEQEAIEREKLELQKLKEERKQKEKEAKLERKKKQKLEKQRKKIEKKKLKEQEKLKNL